MLLAFIVFNHKASTPVLYEFPRTQKQSWRLMTCAKPRNKSKIIYMKQGNVPSSPIISQNRCLCCMQSRGGQRADHFFYWPNIYKKEMNQRTLCIANSKSLCFHWVGHLLLWELLSIHWYTLILKISVILLRFPRASFLKSWHTFLTIAGDHPEPQNPKNSRSRTSTDAPAILP